MIVFLHLSEESLPVPKIVKIFSFYKLYSSGFYIQVSDSAKINFCVWNYIGVDLGGYPVF